MCFLQHRTRQYHQSTEPGDTARTFATSARTSHIIIVRQWPVPRRVHQQISARVHFSSGYKLRQCIGLVEHVQHQMRKKDKRWAITASKRISVASYTFENVVSLVHTTFVFWIEMINMTNCVWETQYFAMELKSGCDRIRQKQMYVMSFDTFRESHKTGCQKRAMFKCHIIITPHLLSRSRNGIE